jgi:hypothetical protein
MKSGNSTASPTFGLGICRVAGPRFAEKDPYGKRMKRIIEILLTKVKNEKWNILMGRGLL